MQQSNSMLGRNTAFCTAIAVLGLALSGAGGCQRAIDANNLGEDPTETATTFEGRMDFWHHLANDRICSNDEAFHGLLLYIEKADKAKNFDERVKLMKYLGMLPDDFDGKAKEAVTRGTVAVALVKVLEIKGGIILHVVPRSERYATRELVYEGVYPPSTQNQVFSGAEFVGIIGRIEDYQRMQPKSAEVATRGSAPEKAATPSKPAAGDPAPQAPGPVTP